MIKASKHDERNSQFYYGISGELRECDNMVREVKNAIKEGTKADLQLPHWYHSLEKTAMATQNWEQSKQ